MNKIIFLKEVPESLTGKVICIDGFMNTTSFDFLSCIWQELNFSHPEHKNWDAYLDWMRDLSWIDEKIISIVILNFEDFLRDEPDAKNFFLSDFEKIIFPFWEHDAGVIFEDNDKIKELHIYCIK